MFHCCECWGATSGIIILSIRSVADGVILVVKLHNTRPIFDAILPQKLFFMRILVPRQQIKDYHNIEGRR